MSDWINKELRLRTVLNHGKITAMLELNSPQYKRHVDCYSGNHQAGQQNKRVTEYPSPSATKACFRARWHLQRSRGVVSVGLSWADSADVLCLRVSRQRSTDRHRGQASWISLGPPAASFTCHEDEDQTDPCSVSFKRLRNSSVWVWSVLFKHLQTCSVKAFSISKRQFMLISVRF